MRRLGSTDDDTTITVTWTLFNQNDQCFLREYWSNDKGCTVWGPIPADMDIAKLIEQRKAQIDRISKL